MSSLSPYRNINETNHQAATVKEGGVPLIVTKRPCGQPTDCMVLPIMTSPVSYRSPEVLSIFTVAMMF